MARLSKQREYVQSNRNLSQKVRSGLEQAELTIIDLPMYRHITISDLLNQGAEAGYDFDLASLNDLTARRMISESPLGRLCRRTSSLLVLSSLDLDNRVLF